MNRIALPILLAALAAALLPAPAAAQVAAPKIVLETKASLLIPDAKTGKVARKPAKMAKTGDLVEYVVTYVNKGTGPAPEVTITDRVPGSTTYVPGSAAGKGAEVTASADGTTFSPPPLRVTETRPDGSTVKVEAGPEAYAHLRWKIPHPLAPGESGSVSFRVRVR